MKDQLFSLSDFQNWLDSYNQSKKNQTDFGVKNVPARIFRKTIDLSTAGVLQNTGIPFTGLQVEKIYNSSTNNSVDGSIKLIFDRAMSDAQFNYKVLKENDCFTTGFVVSNGYFSWDAQPNVKADIVFFNDVDYKSGSQKTSITGTVTTTPANNAATQIKQLPSSTVQRQAVNTSTSYAVPAGFYGIANFGVVGYSAQDAYVKINTVFLCRSNGAISVPPAYSLNHVFLMPGDVVEMYSQGTTATVGMTIALYPI